MILLAAAIVIDPSFMASVIDGPATFRNYLEIAWFSASMESSLAA